MIQTGDLNVYEGKPFGNIMMCSSYSELIELGFESGDSVNIYFSNGASLEDIPFLSGCILPEGIVCLNAYAGFDWIRVEKRFGRVWEPLGMQENETGKIMAVYTIDAIFVNSKSYIPKIPKTGIN